MRKLKIIEHVSLDGVVQHSADGDDFPYPDWNLPYRTPEGRDAVLALHGERFDLVLGRHTYDLWARFWPTAPANPMADRINAATKYVATHRPESLRWGPVEPLGPDVAEGVRRVKATDGPDLVLCGSSTLASTLLGDGLADEVLLIVYPIVLGTGKRLVAEGTPARSLELADTSTTPSGVVLSRYRVTGPLPVG
ncbi:dihydrofolate reductase [Actinocatenispora thailandica]|uniref:Dihydrofolate reductase n=1 Tax=Actinocatenispora thailandica TaxID=227318 RepID=A0A7R7DTD9_9ACTN|nr:dihydrofolate reductase family protein [Actinocatenispora thailandica]BCJ37436.1 dihydrofolate reductase [Actinocatenispora thailandica]